MMRSSDWTTSVRRGSRRKSIHPQLRSGYALPALRMDKTQNYRYTLNQVLGLTLQVDQKDESGQGPFSFYGTVFKVNTDGTGFTPLYDFTALSFPNNTNIDGAEPNAGLILSSNTLYGTTEIGGSSGDGTLFSLFILPQLKIIPSGSGVILTWPTNAAGFILQSTTNLVSDAIWSAVSPGPVVVNGQNVVTNPSSSAQQFYRLSQ